MAKGKILIVDDDPDIALATRLCLESAGYEVLEAHNSAIGLETIQSNRPDLIVLDVMMDSTTEGFQMALTLRSPDAKSPYQAYRDIPIIMQTSIHSTTPVRFAPDQDYLPVDKFLDKPVEPEELLQVVAGLLKKAT
jgi:CheY-like chemotaxis protein